VGTGLYILCEVLTGRKFFGNYWNDDCIFSEIEDRIGRNWQYLQPPDARFSVLIGDLASVSLELSATVIAGLRDRRYIAPEGLEGHPALNADPRYLRSQISMFTTYDCLPDADAAQAWLVETLTSAPTRPSLTGLTITTFNRYCEPSRLRLYSLAERPAATTLAVVMRLWHNNKRQANNLITCLPTPLVSGALQQARFALTTQGETGGLKYLPGAGMQNSNWGRAASKRQN